MHYTLTRPAARRPLAALALLGALAAGCAPETIDDHPCPPGGTSLTYESFGQEFLQTRCQTCHGAGGSERQGAPSSFDFGSRESARRTRARIFVRAAAGNTTMPPGPDDPPEAERAKLADWLACGAP